MARLQKIVDQGTIDRFPTGDSQIPIEERSGLNHPALCLLETIVHVERDDEMLDTYQLLSVEIPDHLIEPVDSSLFPLDWQANIAITQNIGNTWLSESKKAGLLVPSVIVPVGKNCLLNPLIPEIANIKPPVVRRFPFLKRLLSH